MIVSLSFIVSASPPALKPFKPPKPPKPPYITLRGRNIPIKRVSPRGKVDRTPKTYQSFSHPIDKVKTLDLTVQKSYDSPLPEEKYSSIIDEIDLSEIGNPPIVYFWSTFKENYKKTLFFSEEIAEWIHSAEVYHTLLELLEALYELGSDSDSDSSDDSDEDGYTYSDTIVVDSTKAVQVVLYLKPINLQQ